MIASTVSDLREETKMAHAHSVDAITDGSLSPTLPKQPGKPSYRFIRYTHHLLTVNVALIKSPRDRGQNGHLRIVLTRTQYNLVSRFPFVRPTNPGRTLNIPL